MSFEQVQGSPQTLAPNRTPSPWTKAITGFARHPLAAIVRMRLQACRNHFGYLKKDSITRLLVVVFGLLNVFGLGFFVSYESFQFIDKFEAFGVALNSKMISLLFFALLILVVLSTVIVAYTTAFLSRETSFFHELPIRPQDILVVKLTESIAFSSWATLFLGYPVLVSYGLLSGAPWLYYLEVAGLLVLFLAFAGLAGALLALVLAPVVHRLSPKQMVTFGIALVAALGFWFLRSFNFGDFSGHDQLLVLDRFTGRLSILYSPYFPSHWAAAGVLSAASGNQQDTLFHTTILLANTLIFFPIIAWFGARYYSPLWLRGQVSDVSRTPRKTKSEKSQGFVEQVSRNRVLSLLAKDIVTFLREPAQLSQSLLFLMLMAIYSFSLVRVPSTLLSGHFQLILFFANLAAVCMILSSFTSRFLFPLISLEGRAFWIVGLAPVPRSFLIYQKVLFGLVVTLTVGLPMAVVSNLALKFPAELIGSAVYAVILSGLCLTSLAIGLGCTYPNFDEDNPSRIAVGVGGTLNFFASAATVALLISVLSAPYLIVSFWRPEDGNFLTLEQANIAAHVAALLITFLVSFSCLRIGIRSLERTEF